MLFICGEGRAVDGKKVIGKVAVQQVVTVVWEQYKSMPLVFFQLLDKLPRSIMCVENWARFNPLHP